jgi:hypothetical protein
MATVVWKFVSTISATPAVTFDMNRQNASVVLNFGETFDISPPAKKRSFTTNSMTDGGLLTSSAYENRVLEFTVSLQGSLTEKAALHRELKKQLSQDRNLIMYTPKAGVINPVFFRTMKSDDYSFTHKTEGGPWHVACKVIAEPFAIGIRVDQALGASVTNNPTSGANPARLDFTGIIGDVPSPPLVKITSPVTGGLKNNPVYIGQRTGRTFFDNWKQAELGTLYTDTSTWTAGSNATGGTPNMIVTTFATATAMGGRLRVQFVPTGGDRDALRGRYRVLMRVGTGTTGSTFKARWATPGGNNWIRGRVAQFTLNLDTVQQKHIDLGMLAHPPYQAPAEIGYSGLAPGIEDMWITIDVERVNGGNFNMDYVYLMPADERLCVVSAATTDAGDGVGAIVLDGPNDMTYGGESTLNLFDTAVANRSLYAAYGLVPRIGGLPILVPGVTNRWYILQESAAVTSTLNFDVHYWPRWLEVATP